MAQNTHLKLAKIILTLPDITKHIFVNKAMHESLMTGLPNYSDENEVSNAKK